MRRLLLVACAVHGLWIPGLARGEVALVGPTPYTRTTGQPSVHSAPFKAIPGAGKIRITNGDPTGAVRVIAVISVNGTQRVGGSTFNAPYSSKEVPVTLARDNVIAIELRGEPGNSLTITVTEDITCTALDPCHVPGTWDRAVGACSNPAASNGTTCNDGNACTQTDTCQAGACVGADPVACAALDQCHVAGVCDPASGQCSNPSASNGITCSDGNACTRTDTCQAGACVGTNPVVCAALDQCHVAGVCEPASGQCPNPAAPDGTACNDGNLCTSSDTCQAGACAGGSPVTCADDHNACTADTCDPARGCVYTDQRTSLPIVAGLDRLSLTAPDGRVSLFDDMQCTPWSGWYWRDGLPPEPPEPHENFCGPTAGMNLLRWYHGPPADGLALWNQLGDEMRTNEWMEMSTAELVANCAYRCMLEPVCTAACAIITDRLVEVGTLPDDVERALARHTPPGYQLIRNEGNPGLGAFEALLREGNPIAVLLWTGSTLHWTVVTGTYDDNGSVKVRFANDNDVTWSTFVHQWSLDGINVPGEEIVGWYGVKDYVWMYYGKATILPPGFAFDVGQENAIFSRDGRFMFFLDSAGHLVLYPTPLTLGTGLWHSGNAVVDAVAEGYWAYMQDDGNLVIYDAGWHAKWDTNTNGHPGAYLAIQNDGNLVIYDADRHTVLWSSNTGGHY